MAHFLCHLGAHILEPFCSISILPKTVIERLVAVFLINNSNRGIQIDEKTICKIIQHPTINCIFLIRINIIITILFYVTNKKKRIINSLVNL